jgi:hypothetical protein
MASGGLIADSLRVGGVLEGVSLMVTKVSRADVGDVEAGQPRTWTFLDFQIADEDTDRLAHALKRTLETRSGWYCDFHSEAETVVVFAGRTFRDPRGDAGGSRRDCGVRPLGRRARSADRRARIGAPICRSALAAQARERA